MCISSFPISSFGSSLPWLMYFGAMVCRLISRRDCVIIVAAVVVRIPSPHTHSYLGVLGFPLPSSHAPLFLVEGGPISTCGQLGLWNHRELKDSPCHRQENSWPQALSSFSYSHRHSASYKPQPRQLSMTTCFQTCLRTWFYAMHWLPFFTWLEIYSYTVLSWEANSSQLQTQSLILLDSCLFVCFFPSICNLWTYLSYFWAQIYIFILNFHCLIYYCCA